MWAKVYLLFCCSIKAKSSFTHILSEPQSLQMLIDQRIFENFRLKQNTCPHNHSYYQRKQYLPEKNKTTAYPLAVNVPYHFLLCLPTFTAEAHTVRKSYCTSFAHAPDWFHCYGILFIPCGGWKINQNYNAILTVIIIAVKWSHWSASWVFKMKMLWSSTVHLVYAV